MTGLFAAMAGLFLRESSVQTRGGGRHGDPLPRGACAVTLVRRYP